VTYVILLFYVFTKMYVLHEFRCEENVVSRIGGVFGSACHNSAIDVLLSYFRCKIVVSG